jgi:hypothetical protein
MSMSQYPSPDEEYDNMWASIRWWQIPILVIVVFLVIPVTVFVSTVWRKLTWK